MITIYNNSKIKRYAAKPIPVIIQKIITAILREADPTFV